MKILLTSPLIIDYGMRFGHSSLDKLVEINKIVPFSFMLLINQILLVILVFMLNKTDFLFL